MGFFSFVSHTWDDATHVASDAWSGATHFVGDVAHDAWSGLSTFGGAVGQFLSHRWKTIAAIAIGTVAFVAVATLAPELLPGLLALAPEAAPWLVLGAAGAASGAASKTFDDLVNGRPLGWDILRSAVITGAATVLTVGTLQWIAPRLGEALPLLKPLTDRFAVAGSTAGDGAGGVSVPPPPAPTADGVTNGSAADPGTAEPATDTSSEDPVEQAGGPTRPWDRMTPKQAVLRAPKSRGIIGLLAGDEGNSTNKRLNRDANEDGGVPSR
jgi:hypothetical protein